MGHNFFVTTVDRHLLLKQHRVGRAVNQLGSYSFEFATSVINSRRKCEHCPKKLPTRNISNTPDLVIEREENDSVAPI